MDMQLDQFSITSLKIKKKNLYSGSDDKLSLQFHQQSFDYVAWHFFICISLASPRGEPLDHRSQGIWGNNIQGDSNDQSLEFSSTQARMIGDGEFVR